VPSDPIQIDQAAVQRWVLKGATNRDIADRLGISQRRLRKELRLELRRWRAIRRIRLRALQWKQAKSGSVPILTLLGKDELGQGQKKPAKQERIVIRRRLVDRSGGRPVKATKEGEEQQRGSA
jgi:hypothetical protein